MDYSRTIGALFVGALVVFVFYGVGSLQTYVYFHVYKRDSRWLKMTVFAIWFLYSLQISFLGHAVYHYVINYHDDPTILAKGYWGLYAAIAFNLPLATAVQLYFTKRIYALASTKAEWERLKYWLTGTVLFFVVIGHLGVGLGLSIRTMILNRLDNISTLRNYAIVVATGHVASEIAISGSLIYLLANSRTAYQRTNDVLNSLIVYAVNRSLLTSVLTCSGIIVFITQRGSLWSMALEFIVTSVHINSMLGALNCRENLRGKTDGTSAESHGLASRLSSRLWRPSALASSPSRFGASGTTGSGWSQDTRVQSGLGIHVTVTKESFTDPTLEDIKLSRNPTPEIGHAV